MIQDKEYKIELSVVVTIIVRLQDHLQNTEDSTSEVQQHVADTPPLSALPSVVHVRLENSQTSHQHCNRLPDHLYKHAQQKYEKTEYYNISVWVCTAYLRHVFDQSDC